MPSVINLSASQALIARARRGDPEAATQLRALYSPRVHQFARQHLGMDQPETLAEAVLDEAFARLHDYDPRHGTFDAWIKRIAARQGSAHRHMQRLALGTVVLLATLCALALWLAPSKTSSAYPASAATPAATTAAVSQPTRPAGPTPVPATPAPTIVPTAGPRVTILLMGIDQRPGETYPPLADAMLLMTLDPRTGDAAVLSIPRDLYVDIPGYGPNRINTAYLFGEAYGEPGGGPGLAVRTVERVFGVDVDHWVVFRFTAFEQGVDLLGGIDVDVQRAIYDPAYPTANYGTEVFALAAGPQHLDGATALKYVRTRHGDSDLRRSARQRQVLLAVKERLSDPGTLAGQLPGLPGFVAALGDNLRSDLTAQEMIQLGLDALKVDTARIRQPAFGPGDISDYTTPTGAQVLLPNWPRIYAVLHEFVDGPCTTCPASSAQSPVGAAEPAAPALRQPTVTPDPLASLRAENARVQVLNGTQISELAEQVAERLRQAGVNVVSTGDAVRRDYPDTFLFAYAQKPVTLGAIAGVLGVPAGNQYLVDPNSGGYDIQVIIGASYTLP
jgi:LCP family protein required for cell wall assembly